MIRDKFSTLFPGVITYNRQMEDRGILSQYLDIIIRVIRKVLQQAQTRILGQTHGRTKKMMKQTQDGLGSGTVILVKMFSTLIRKCIFMLQIIIMTGILTFRIQLI